MLILIILFLVLGFLSGSLLGKHVGNFGSLTVIMLCIITFISTLVHLYSIEYMSTDPHLTRFMSYLSLFTFFIHHYGLIINTNFNKKNFFSFLI